MGVDLITGGSGFFGTLLAERLVRGGRTVRVLDIVEPPAETRDVVEWHKASVLDERSVGQAMSDVEVVYHSAALVPLTRAGKRFTDINVSGTEVVADCALRAGVARFVHISSSAVYDPRTTSMPITEHTPECPVGSYGASKYAAERVALDRVSHGLNAVILRPRTIVDSGRSGIFQILFDWISRGARVIVVGDGSETFQLVSGRDLAEASLLCAAKDVPAGAVINVGADEFGTYEELIAALITHAGTGSRITHVPLPLARRSLAVLDRMRLSPLTDWHYLTLGHPFHFANDRAHELLGWRPQDSNDQMMARAYDYYVANTPGMLAATGSAHRTAPQQGALRLLRRR